MRKRKVLVIVLAILIGISALAVYPGKALLAESSSQENAVQNAYAQITSPVLLFEPEKTLQAEQTLELASSRFTNLTDCTSETELTASIPAIRAGAAVVTFLPTTKVNLGGLLARCGVSEAARGHITGPASPDPGDGTGGVMAQKGAFDIQGWRLTADGVIDTFEANSNVSMDDVIGDLHSWLTAPTAPTVISGRSSADDKAVLADDLSSSWRLSQQDNQVQTQNPYGQVHYSVAFYKLNDNSTSPYDWWDVHLFADAEPGIMLWPSTSQYSTHYFWAKEEGLATYRELLKWGPTTTNNSTSYGVDIGVTAGMNDATVTAENSWFRTIPDVNVIDQTNPAACNAHWELDFQPDTNAANATYAFEPGSQFRVPHGYSFNPSINIMGQFCIHHWYGWDSTPQNVQVGNTYVCVQ